MAKIENRRKTKAVVCLFISVLLSGCATTTFKASHFLSDKIRFARTIAVFPIDVEVYQVSAGGVSELVDQYSEEAKANIKSALQDELSKHGNYQLKHMPEISQLSDAESKQLYKDTLALFKAVDTSVILHTFKVFHPMQGIFQDKVNNFDYTLGPQISPINSNSSADMLLFIRGGDYVSSGGRVALMVWTTLMGFMPTNAGPPHLSAALVDPKSGDLLWYNYYCPEGGYNFRDRKSVGSFANVLLKDFPSNAK